MKVFSRFSHGSNLYLAFGTHSQCLPRTTSASWLHYFNAAHSIHASNAPGLHYVFHSTETGCRTISNDLTNCSSHEKDLYRTRLIFHRTSRQSMTHDGNDPNSCIDKIYPISIALLSTSRIVKFLSISVRANCTREMDPVQSFRRVPVMISDKPRIKGIVDATQTRCEGFKI